jgi:trypsin-like peptidase
MPRNPLAVVLACGFILLSPLPAARSEPLIEQVKQAVVFLGRLHQQGKRQILEIKATGCLLNIEGINHLLTVRHLLLSDPQAGPQSVNDRNLVIMLNKKDGTVAYLKIEQVKKHGAEWVFHPNPQVDLAVIPVLLNTKSEKITTIPESLFFGPEGLHELDDVFYLSFQPGVPFDKGVLPVIRKGAISRINADGTLLIDGFTFHGNSGSPVFLTPTPFHLNARGYIESGDDGRGGRFIGIIGAYVKDRKKANTGLSLVWPTQLIRELVDSDAFQAQIAKLKKK